MADVASPPTARALDVVELLAHADGQAYRLSEIAEVLGLSIATAHNILSTLVDRGWAARDATDKTFTVGPVLDITAAAAGSPRALARRAQSLTVELAARLGCATSVVERSGDDLVITCFQSTDPELSETTTGESYPYSPPFGCAFAAWDTPQEQDAWVERGAAGNEELAQRLRQGLDITRARGFDVDRTTPALAQAIQLVGTLDTSRLPSQVRQLRDQLAEFAALGFLPDPDTKATYEVFSIAVPIFDQRGRVRLNIGVHPLRRMTARQVTAMGKRLLTSVEVLNS
ncbi:IclR family transcriptional regulator [Nocardia sp. BMG111209]|uniref:IclR family transcriptional regulator n=1 Tax=Nocardia sp. BMG111209 TaxID=1160137 RepID=UPI00036633B4|nr:helix-turn-helix domain-containing protein [Nocardia sp. BMG111209]